MQVALFLNEFYWVTFSFVVNTDSFYHFDLIIRVKWKCSVTQIFIPNHTFLVRSAKYDATLLDQAWFVLWRLLLARPREPGAGGRWEERTNTISQMHWLGPTSDTWNCQRSPRASLFHTAFKTNLQCKPGYYFEKWPSPTTPPVQTEHVKKRNY